MTKHERLLLDLEKTGTGRMKVFGNSMLPIIKSGSTLTYKTCDEYQINDIVFCKVKGRWIDAHKITKIDNDRRYMIANNHGYENGWTKHVYAKVIGIEEPNR